MKTPDEIDKEIAGMSDAERIQMMDEQLAGLEGRLSDMPEFLRPVVEPVLTLGRAVRDELARRMLEDD